MSEGTDAPRTLSNSIPAIPAPSAPSAPASRADEDAKARIAALEREARALGATPQAAVLFHEVGRLWEHPLRHPRNAAVAYQSAFKLAPAFVANIRAARRLFGEVGNWVMVVQLLDAELKVLPDGSKARPALLHEKALVLEQRLSREADALAAWADCLAAAPEDVSLLCALEALFAERADHASLVKVQRRLAVLASDEATRAQYLTSAGIILEDRLKQLPEAAACFRAAFQLERRDPLLLAAIKRIAQREGTVDEELAALAAEAEGQGALAAPTYLQISKAYERLDRPEDALAALVAARRVAPGDPLVLAELARIYESQARHEELADALTAWAQAIPDPSEQLALQLRVAQLFEERLKRDADAVTRYRAILERAPGHVVALASLGKLYHRAQNWVGLAETYEAEAASIDEPKQKVTRLYKAGEVLEERLQRYDDAIARYQDCLRQSPGYLPAQKALTRLYERLGRWAELLSTWEQELGQGGDREQQIATLTKMAAVCEDKLLEPARAIECLKRILELANDHIPTLRHLARLYERDGKWQELIELQDQEAGLSGDTRHIVSIVHRTAEIFEEHLKDRGAATQAWERVLQLSPNYPPALKALGRLYAQDAKWDELIRMYRAEADIASSPAQAAPLVLKIGELLEQRLRAVPEAIAAYREVLTLEPSSVAAVRALARIYRQKGEWEPLIDILRTEASSRTDPSERANAMFQAAAIWEDHLAKPEKAIEGYHEVLRLSPVHPTAQQQLERLLTSRDDVRELVVLLDRQVQTGPPATKVAANLKLARLYLDRLNEPLRAAQCCEAALQVDPASLSALKLLERIHAADRTRRGPTRERLLERLTDQRLKAALKVTPQGRDEVPSNLADLKAAAQVAPADETLGRLLERQLLQSDDVAGLIELYERRRTAASDPTDRATLQLRLGELFEERQGNHAAAAAAYQEALTAAPGLMPAVQGLARSLAAQGEAAKAIAVLDEASSEARDPQTAQDVLLLGAQLAQRSGDGDRAAGLYKKVLELNPLHPVAGPALEDLLASKGGAEDVAALQERRGDLHAAQQELPAAAAAFHTAAQQWLQLGNREKARAALSKALAAQPTHPDALELQADLAAQDQSFAEAVAIYAVRVEQGGNAARLAAVHFKLGALYHDELNDLAKAAGHLSTVLATLPDHVEALERLTSIHAVTKNWTGAADCQRRLLELAKTPDDRARHLVALAALLDEGFADGAQAATHYRQALELKPNDAAILDKLSALYERLGNQRELAEMLEQQIARGGEPRAVAALKLRVASLYAGPLQANDKAIATWRSLVSQDPGNTAALEALAAAYAKDPATTALAIDTQRALLKLEPARVESWRALFKLWESIRAIDKAFCAAGVLTFLKVANEAESAFYTEGKNRLSHELNVVLAGADLVTLHHPQARSPVLDVLRAVGDQLGKPYPPQFEPWGVDRKADRLKNDHAIYKAARVVTAALGIEEHDVYTAKRGLVQVEAGEPMSLLVGGDLVRRFNLREQRFLFGRAAVQLVDKSALLKRLSATEAADWVGNSVRIHKPGWTKLGTPNEEASKQLRKWYSRKALKQLEEPADAVAAVAEIDMGAVTEGLAFSADRAGLTFAGDVAAALGLLVRDDVVPGTPRLDTPESLIRACSERRELRELLTFAASDDLFRLRQRLGLSLG